MKTKDLFLALAALFIGLVMLGCGEDRYYKIYRYENINDITLEYYDAFYDETPFQIRIIRGVYNESRALLYYQDWNEEDGFHYPRDPSLEFTVDSLRLNNLVDKLLDFQITDWIKLGGAGEDGATVNLEFGSRGNWVEYKIWAPTYATERRELTLFVEICREILEIADFNPDDYLPIEKDIQLKE